ncbi:MAG TPA: glycoside hydrolase family 15 protein, partial [Acidocella sp.]|nr:glycoside hydrolase family 15 protein [Acidocella sp.]
ALAGRHEQARALFERILAVRNHVGLLSEDLIPEANGAPHRLWGNFPQTYSQVGLILCAMRLSRSWEDGLWRAS